MNLYYYKEFKTNLCVKVFFSFFLLELKKHTFSNSLLWKLLSPKLHLFARSLRKIHQLLKPASLWDQQNCKLLSLGYAEPWFVLQVGRVLIQNYGQRRVSLDPITKPECLLFGWTQHGRESNLSDVVGKSRKCRISQTFKRNSNIGCSTWTL